MLGRDAASVFPTEAKKAAVDNAGLAELLGAGKAKFISETEAGPPCLCCVAEYWVHSGDAFTTDGSSAFDLAGRMSHSLATRQV